MSTILDIVEQGCVLIVFSLQQMNNIHTKLDMIPDLVLITCEALGRHHAQAAQSSSSHIATDLIAMHGALARATSIGESDYYCVFVGDSELAFGIGIACAGRH